MSESTDYPKQLKKLRLLDNRLSTLKQKNDAVIPLNQAVAEIKKLRERINNECRERVIFDNVFKNLEIDLKKNDHELRGNISISMSVDNKVQEFMDELTFLQKQVNF